MTRGIILAGDTGSRLGSLSKVTNKHLLPVGPCPMVFHPISQMLLNEERVVTPHANKAIVTCSLCGSPMPEPDKAIPTIRFPVLGETHIFAVNSADVSCTDRFEASRGITPRGKKNSKKWVGARLFPFCSRCQKDVSNATQYIIDKQRNGKTWSKIPGKNGSDLFISYCSDNPALSLDVPLLVSGDTSQLFEVVSDRKSVV